MTLAEVNLGAVHAQAQSLVGRFPVGYGLANALFLPYVMEFNVRPAARNMPGWRSCWANGGRAVARRASRAA
jgi:alcohol dehydrogenase class IV